MVRQTALYLREHPEVSIEELMAWSEDLAGRMRMGLGLIGLGLKTLITGKTK